MNTAHRTLSLLLLLLAMTCTGLQAQTIVELKRGGTVRASSTVYFNRTTISTGLEEIAHRSKQDISVQLRLRW